MSDVYAGDEGLTAAATTTASTVSYIYVVLADPDPDVLLRVASQLLLTNQLPKRVLLTRPTPEQVVVEVELVGVGATTAESIRRKLSQLSCTESVSLSTG